jgi:hypothetical protein
MNIEIQCTEEKKTVGVLALEFPESGVLLDQRTIVAAYTPNDEYGLRELPRHGETWRCPRCGYPLSVSGMFLAFDKKGVSSAEMSSGVIVVGSTRLLAKLDVATVQPKRRF